MGEIGTVTSAGEAIADSQVLAASAVDCPSIFRARFQPTHTVWRQTQTGHHGHRPTTSAKESITSPQAPRPTRPHRVTLPRSDEHSCLSLHRDPCRHLEPSGQTSPASALGPRPMPQAPVARSPMSGSAALPSTMRRHPKPTHRAPTAREGLGRIVRQAPVPPPTPRTYLSPEPSTQQNLPTGQNAPNSAKHHSKPANRPIRAPINVSNRFIRPNDYPKRREQTHATQIHVAK